MILRNVEFKPYNGTDVILWTIGITLSVVSIVYAILAYHFSSKSNKLLQEHIRKTWLVTETDKIFFKNLKAIKRACTHTISNLSSSTDITFNDYFIFSSGTRINHISKDTIELFKKTKFSEIVEEYLIGKETCDKFFFEVMDIRKLSSRSKETMSEKTIEDMIEYNSKVIDFCSNILRKYTDITT